MKLELGKKVQFQTDYIKAREYLDPDNATDEQMENGVALHKLVLREHETIKEGVICGKRKYAVISHLYFDVEYYNENTKSRFYSHCQEYDTFYLVATNLNGFHKVRECDLLEVN